LISRWQFVDFQIEKITVKNNTIITSARAFIDNSDELEKVSAEIGYIDTTYYRLKRVAIEMILDHPLIGVGLGGFNDEIRKYKKDGKLPDIFPAMDPHCMILGKAAQTGLVGLIALVILWGKSIRKALNMSFTSRDNYFQIISWAMFSSMVGFVIQSIDMDIMNFRFLWFLFAFVFVVESLESTSKSHIWEGPQT
jgi:O-antigen ligase